MEPRPAPLLQAWLEIVAPWRAVFPQTRSYPRALRQALTGLICLGRRTVLLNCFFFARRDDFALWPRRCRAEP
jgi:hypothetical protein